MTTATPHVRKKPNGGRNGGKRRTADNLTPAIQKGICDAISLHIPVAFAAGRMGISPTDVSNWKARGRKAYEYSDTSPAEKPYIEFYLAIKKAQADAVTAGLTRIQQAARGGNVLKRTVRTRIVNGQPETIVEETVAPADWSADKWMLERTHPEYFDQNRAEIRALEKELEQAHTVINQLLAKLAARTGENIAMFASTPNALPQHTEVVIERSLPAAPTPTIKIPSFKMPGTKRPAPQEPGDG